MPFCQRENPLKYPFKIPLDLRAQIKPSLQSAYVDDKLSEEFDKIYAEIDSTFSEFVEENVFVFN